MGSRIIHRDRGVDRADVSGCDETGMAGSATRQELEALILDKLSNVLDNKQKANKFKNLLYAMSRVDKSIIKTGGKLKGKWMATERYK